MPRLRDFDLARHLADPALKPRFVTPMFDLVAPRYDEFTRVFSFGMDRPWKRELVTAARAHAPAARTVLDVACGTGDIAFAMAAAYPGAAVRGVDASARMLALARRRASHDGGRNAGVVFEPGDLADLPADDASCDLVTAGYAFRNAPAVAPAVAEAARVLRPGGILAVLDFYRPALAPWRVAFTWYLQAAGNLVGWWWHREPLAYGYIAHSVRAHDTVAEFSARLEGAGFDVLEVRTHLGGGIALHLARRRAPAPHPIVHQPFSR
ncbi:MAG TPA: ubiquinone/menaquinone biosynthesis methyltransferase [Gemmatimonadaceae bacterium]|nr:ubiquinone/menaquinone biosynthesis methyltransferase [Gemmatimonadaceae bacterium]